jgi:tripartite-type tricarboxylate transporter receptor subunit TctC
MKRRSCVFLAAFVAASFFASAPASQDLAGRPVRVIVPVPPGGPSDTAMRLIAPRMSEGLGRPLVLDNRPGANGVAGTSIAAKAAPDGNTLAIGNSGTHAINASLYRKLPYDPQREFTPIVQLVTSGMVLVGHPRVPGRSLPELIEAAKREPGKLNVGIAGATGELTGDALWIRSGVRVHNVRYKGSAPTEVGLLSGEVDLAMLTPLATRQHIQAGKLKAFGISSAQRNPVLPEVPTIAEQGVPGFDFQIWHGIFAPKGTPQSVVRAVHREAVAALSVPAVRERFNTLGFVVIGNSPEEFAAIVKREIEKFGKIIAESGIERL